MDYDCHIGHCRKLLLMLKPLVWRWRGWLMLSETVNKYVTDYCPSSGK